MCIEFIEISTKFNGKLYYDLYTILFYENRMKYLVLKTKQKRKQNISFLQLGKNK